MSNFNTNDNNTNNDDIDALWVMGGARAEKDYATKEVIGYMCYCIKCKEKSSTGDGGILFATAKELLEHRNMKAFKCPAGCSFHVCEERGSIMRHVNDYHPEIMRKLEKEGLDPKKSWITPDYTNNSYTLNKPKSQKIFTPDTDNKSPIEQVAAMLGNSANTQGIIKMKHPKRVEASPSPTQSPTPYNYSNAKGWSPIVQPIAVPLSDVIKQQTVSQSEQTNQIKQKKWYHTQSSFTPLDVIIDEQKHESTEPINCADEIIIHYAQEDMRKEKQCSYGTTCSKKESPFKCAMNHDGLGDIIKIGTILSEDILCPYERPGFKRCYNGHCTKIHLEGRVEFIEKKKKAYYENKRSSNGQDTSSVSVNENETKVVLSQQQIKDIKDTVQKLVTQSSNNNECISSASLITALVTVPDNILDTVLTDTVLTNTEPTNDTTYLVVNGIEHKLSSATAQAIKETIDEFGHQAGDSYEDDWIQVSHVPFAKQQAKLAKAAQLAQLAQPTIEA
jgi:hypothetical protein